MTKAILDELVALLDGASLSLPFTVFGTYYREVQPTEFDELTLIVQPFTRVPDLLARGRELKTFGYGIYVIKKLDDTTEAFIDPLIEFVEQIEDFLNSEENEVLDGTGVTRSAVLAAPDTIYDTDEMESNSRFWSTVVVEYTKEVNR